MWTLDGTRAADHRLLSSCVACLMILTFSYHQAYDALLLALPAVALATAGDGSSITRVLGRNTRRVLLALLLVPAVNYAATDTAVFAFSMRGPLWTAVTSANGAALALAFVIATVSVMRAMPPRARARELPAGAIGIRSASIQLPPRLPASSLRC